MANEVDTQSWCIVANRDTKLQLHFFDILNSGLYTFEIHYRSSVAIDIGATWDWQAALLQVMWLKMLMLFLIESAFIQHHLQLIASTIEKIRSYFTTTK